MARTLIVLGPNGARLAMAPAPSTPGATGATLVRRVAHAARSTAMGQAVPRAVWAITSSVRTLLTLPRAPGFQAEKRPEAKTGPTDAPAIASSFGARSA